MSTLLLAAAVPASAAAQSRVFEPPPAPTRWVTDGAGLLSSAPRVALDARLESYERQTGRQVLVWISRTTGGVPIEDFAVRTFEHWRIGRRGIDDGLVLFIFTEDRRARIEVGYGIEGLVPDAIASRIILEDLTPRLQAGDADGAVSSAVTALLAAVGDESGPSQRTEGAPRVEAPPWSLAQKLFAVLVGIAFLVLLVTHPSLALYLLFSILSGGRGGGGGFSGGGFSGGGGRSGGGGASGSW